MLSNILRNFGLYISNLSGVRYCDLYFFRKSYTCAIPVLYSTSPKEFNISSPSNSSRSLSLASTSLIPSISITSSPLLGSFKIACNSSDSPSDSSSSPDSSSEVEPSPPFFCDFFSAFLRSFSSFSSSFFSFSNAFCAFSAAFSSAFCSFSNTFLASASAFSSAFLVFSNSFLFTTGWTTLILFTLSSASFFSSASCFSTTAITVFTSPFSTPTKFFPL